MDNEREINEQTMIVKEEDLHKKKDSETVKMEPERKRLKQLSRSTNSESEYSAYSNTDSDLSIQTDTEWKRRYKHLKKAEAATEEERREKKEKLEQMLQKTKITPPWLLRKRNSWSKKLE